MGMKVQVKTLKDDTPRMKEAMDGLRGKVVNVGVLSGEHAWLASIHEYGCKITPRGQYLTIPCNSKAVGRSARDFPDLFFLRTKEGNKFLVRNKGKDQIEFMFMLAKEVNIPERSFLRAGFDQHHEEVLKKAQRLMKPLMDGSLSPDDYCDAVGQLLSDKIKNFARQLNSPPKSNITLAANPNKANPLVQTGDMIGSITWEVK